MIGSGDFIASGNEDLNARRLILDCGGKVLRAPLFLSNPDQSGGAEYLAAAVQVYSLARRRFNRRQHELDPSSHSSDGNAKL
jgi:hypothetical protein